MAKKRKRHLAMVIPVGGRALADELAERLGRDYRIVRQNRGEYFAVWVAAVTKVSSVAEILKTLPIVEAPSGTASSSFVVLPDDSDDIRDEIQAAFPNLNVVLRSEFLLILDRNSAPLKFGAPVRRVMEVGDAIEIKDDHPQVDVVPERLEIAFDPTLTREQVLGTLTALADFFRACGGAGLAAEFEEQEAVPEDVHA